VRWANIPADTSTLYTHTIHYKICKFSQSTGRRLFECKHALVIISRAICSVLRGLESLRSDLLFESFSSEVDIVACSTRSLICFNTPTNSSSTLCSMPTAVSMNLASQGWARFRPSTIVKKEWKWFHILYFFPNA
jgi:hypothetical protein